MQLVYPIIWPCLYQDDAFPPQLQDNFLVCSSRSNCHRLQENVAGREDRVRSWSDCSSRILQYIYVLTSLRSDVAFSLWGFPPPESAQAGILTRPSGPHMCARGGEPPPPHDCTSEAPCLCRQTTAGPFEERIRDLVDV